MKVSIVILNWNGAKMLQKYLPSVLKYSQRPDVEVVVADNASTDDSLLILKSFPEVRTIVLDKNYGFAEGYNLALKNVEAEYYLLLNSDVDIRQEHWLEPMLEYMDKHAECAACQPKILSLCQPEMFEYAGASGGFIDKYGYPFCRGRILSTIEKDLGQYDDVCQVSWATGAALLIRSADFKLVKGFDGRFFAHMEEIDLCWRLQILGRTIVCVPASTVYHLGGATLHQGNPKKTYLNYRNNLFMLYKNLPSSQLRSVMRVRTYLDWLSAVPYLLKFDFANFSAIVRARRDFHKAQAMYAADRVFVAKHEDVDLGVERTSYSILWRYFIKRQKTYKDLF